MASAVPFSVSPNFFNPLWPGANITIRWENPDRQSTKSFPKIDIEYYRIDGNSGESTHVDLIAEDQDMPGSKWFILPKTFKEEEDHYLEFRSNGTVFYRQYLNVNPGNAPKKSNNDLKDGVGVAIGGLIGALILLSILAIVMIVRRRNELKRINERRKRRKLHPRPQISPPLPIEDMKSLKAAHFRHEKHPSDATLPVYQHQLPVGSYGTPTIVTPHNRIIQSVYISRYNTDAELDNANRPDSIHTHPYTPTDREPTYRPHLSLSTILSEGGQSTAYELPSTNNRTPADEEPPLQRAPSRRQSQVTIVNIRRSSTIRAPKTPKTPKTPTAIPELHFLKAPVKPGMSPRVNFRLDTGVDGRDSTGLTAVTPKSETSGDDGGVEAVMLR